MSLVLQDYARLLDLEVMGPGALDAVVDVRPHATDVPREGLDVRGQCVIVLGEQPRPHEPGPTVGVTTCEPAAPSSGRWLVCRDQRPLPQVNAQVEALFSRNDAAEARLVLTTTQVLTHASLAGGAEGVMQQLAARINGWAVLVDARGNLLGSAGAGTLHLQEARDVVLHRPVRRRHSALIVHPVGTHDTTRAYLVTAARAGLTSRTRDTTGHAADLISLTLTTHSHSALERFGRNAIVDILTHEPSPALGPLADGIGLPADQVQAFAVSVRSRSVDLEDLLERWLVKIGAAHAFSSTRRPCVGLLEPAMADEFTATVTQAVRHSSLPVACGLGSPRPIERASESAAQALHAHAIARAHHSTVLRYSDMGASALLEKTFSAETTRDLAAVLRPLVDDGTRGADALRVIQTFLAENGNINRTASTLGIHRHTVRQRLAHAAAVTGLDMDNADDRALAWLAFKATATQWRPSGPRRLGR